MAIFGAAIIGVSIAIIFNRKIEETIAPAAMVLMLFMYFTSRCISITPGFVLSLIAIGGSLAFCIFKLITDAGAVKRAVCTYGGAAFAFYLLFFAAYSFHRDFSHPDELYNFGLAAKEYYSFHTIYSPLATSFSGNHPPLIPLWNCLGAMMWTGFSDSICYFGQNMFTISLMLPVFAHIRKKTFGVIDFTIFLLILPLVLLLSGMDGFRYVICDMLLAAQLCFFLINAISYLQSQNKIISSQSSDRTLYFHYICMVLAVSVMCLTKRVGVLFAAVAILSVAGAFLSASPKKARDLVGLVIASTVISFTWFGISAYVAIPVVLFACAFIFHHIFAWIMVTDRRYRFMLVGMIICVAAALIGGFMFMFLARDAYGNAVCARFMEDLFRISFGGEDSDGYICLSYGFFILAAVISAMICLDRNDSNDSKALYPQMFLYTAAGMVIYALIMLYVHISQIGPINEYRESIIPRYMIPFEIMVAFLILYIFIIEKEDASTTLIMAALIVILVISDSGTFFQGIFAKHRCIGYTALQDAGVEPKSGDLIYFIDEQNYFSYSDREFYYVSFPARTNFVDQIFLGNNGRIEMTAYELSQDIANDRYLDIPYNYVYLQTFDEDFPDRYGELFEDPDDITPGSAYRVIINDGDVVLSKLTK